MLHKLQKMLSVLKDDFPNADIFLFGDFNFPNVDWSTLSSSSQEAQMFVDLTLDFNLVQMINESTRVNNILDLCLASVPEIVKSVSVIDGFSDHKLIHMTVSLAPSRNITGSKFILDYNKADFDKINAGLLEFFESYVMGFSCRTVGDNWSLFKNKLLDLTTTFVPRVRIRTNSNKPWYNKTLYTMSSKRKRLFKVAKSYNSETAWSNYNAWAKLYINSLRFFKDKFYICDLPTVLKNNPKKFWKLISPNEPSRSIQLTSIDGNIIPDAECPSVFNNFFS